jgi:alanyl-tRNA synthetase
MVSGGRALDVFQQVWEQNRQVSQAFSAKVMETGEAARKMNEALAAEKFRSAGLEKQVFAAIAESFRGQGNVLHFAKELAAGAVRELADAIAGVCGGTAAVFCGEDTQGYQMCLVNKSADVKQLGQDLTKALQGRGGGKPGYFQGSVRATKAEIESFFSK